MSLRLALVGLKHGATYLPVIDRHPQAELVAVVDRDPERCRTVTERYDVPALSDLESLLDARLADAVILAVPTPVHAEMSVRCLDAGLHVLQEKPLCRNEDEAQQIAQAVTAHPQQVFQVGFECRSSTLHQAILQHIARGDLGRVTNVWYNQHTLEKSLPGTWRRDRRNMGGKFFDCAVHFVDLMQQWAGAPVQRVAALGHVLGRTGLCETDIPESLALAVEYGNGVRGTYNFGSQNDFDDDATFGVAGTSGRIMGNPWLPERAGSYQLITDYGRRRSEYVLNGRLCSKGHLGFTEQMDYFIKAVLENGPNMFPIDDALALHDQMLAIDQSLATGQIVRVESRPSLRSRPKADKPRAATLAPATTG